jgi:hypothetical protein
MCYNPYTSEHTFISCPVPKPESPSHNSRHCEVEGRQIQQQRNNNKIECQIWEWSEQWSMKAMRRNGFLLLSEREGRFFTRCSLHYIVSLRQAHPSATPHCHQTRSSTNSSCSACNIAFAAAFLRSVVSPPIIGPTASSFLSIGVEIGVC